MQRAKLPSPVHALHAYDTGVKHPRAGLYVITKGTRLGGSDVVTLGWS